MDENIYSQLKWEIDGIISEGKRLSKTSNGYQKSFDIDMLRKIIHEAKIKMDQILENAKTEKVLTI